jgi:hypothetical protein
LYQKKWHCTPSKFYTSAPGMAISLSNQAERHAHIPFMHLACCGAPGHFSRVGAQYGSGRSCLRFELLE